MIPVRTAAVNSLPRVSARLHRCIAALRQTMHMACRSCNKTYVNLQSHFLFDLAEAADGEIEVFLRMAGGDLRADAVATLRDDGIAEADDIHALFKHPAALLGIFAVAAGLEGYILRTMHWPLRVLAVIGGLTLLIPGTVSDLIGLVIVAGIIALQVMQNKKAARETA